MKPTPLFYFTTLLRDRATGHVLFWHRGTVPFCSAVRLVYPSPVDATYIEVWMNDVDRSALFLPPPSMREFLRSQDKTIGGGAHG